MMRILSDTVTLASSRMGTMSLMGSLIFSPSASMPIARSLKTTEETMNSILILLSRNLSYQLDESLCEASYLQNHQQETDLLTGNHQHLMNLITGLQLHSQMPTLDLTWFLCLFFFFGEIHEIILVHWKHLSKSRVLDLDPPETRHNSFLAFKGNMIAKIHPEWWNRWELIDLINVFTQGIMRLILTLFTALKRKKCITKRHKTSDLPSWIPCTKWLNGDDNSRALSRQISVLSNVFQYCFYTKFPGHWYILPLKVKILFHHHRDQLNQLFYEELNEIIFQPVS